MGWRIQSCPCEEALGCSVVRNCWLMLLEFPLLTACWLAVLMRWNTVP